MRISLHFLCLASLLLSITGVVSAGRLEDPPLASMPLLEGERFDTTDIVDVVAPERIPLALGGTTLRVPAFATHSLDGTTTGITRAIIVIHGTLRNADDYFQSVVEAGHTVPGADTSTFIVAPQFLTEADIAYHDLSDDLLYWAYMGWRKGDHSLDSDEHPRPARISAFSIADTLMARIGAAFPDLEEIIVAGHSAGGQFANLLAAGNRSHETIASTFGVGIRYIVSNPSTYIYFNERRWIPGTAFVFELPSPETIADCPDYNDYKYGLNNPNPYMAIGSELLQSQYSSRRVIYLLGSADTDPYSYYLDRTCPAMLQGSQRYERGIVYTNHLVEHFGTALFDLHALAIVQGVGHNQDQMFRSSCGVYWLFDYGACADVPPDTPWQDVTTSQMRGVTAHSVAAADDDNDGDLDLYLTVYEGRNKRYRGELMWSFIEATTPPLDDPGHGMMGSFGDYDNDGLVDIYLANWRDGNRLFHNDGNGTYSDSTAGPLGDTGDVTDAIWSDYDRDGDLDLYIVRTNGQENRLLRNDGPGGFVDATQPPVDDDGSGRGAVWCDYDNDGDPDLYVCNDGGNRLYRNDGGGFTDVTTAALAGPGNGSGAAWGDYDNDGDLDLYMANRGRQNRLVRNDGGSFTDVTSPPLNDNGLGRSVSWGDYDNDGWIDILLANNSGRSRLFHNENGEGFSDATTYPLDAINDLFGASWIDQDQDGDLDLALATRGGFPKSLRNQVWPPRHWLHVDLLGSESNRSGFGAKVRVVAGGMAQIREVGCDAAYNAQNSPTVEFGLGVTSWIDTLQVFWPSGFVQSAVGFPADRRLRVHESNLPAGAATWGAGVNPALARPNPFAETTSLRLVLDRPASASVKIFDPAGRLVRILARRTLLAAGAHSWSWDGRNDAGNRVAPGVYIGRIGLGAEARSIHLIRVGRR